MTNWPVFLKKIINSLEVNIKKTNIIIFQKGGFKAKDKLSKFFFNGKPIEFAKTYTYLGVTFSQSVSFEAASNEFSNKAKRAIHETVSLLSKMKKIDRKFALKCMIP